MVASAINFILFSSAFSPKGAIPAKYTCEGQNVSPPLSWQGAPTNTKSFALIMDDPDAPDPQHPKTTWVHWVLYNIPVNVTSLKEHLEKLPEGTGEGLNDWHKTGYGGPCPPIGRHRYFHKIYALDTKLTGLKQPSKAELEKAMQGHILAHAELVGTYAKKGN
ncbi:MAG: YbhB/YbcL family Raf kinase inhibitor-like protein [Pseudobdellovibrionaceae bacterium]